MARPKGQPKLGGRKKGTPNKVSKEAKTAIAEAAEMLGGVNRLVTWAQEDAANERAFWATIYPKLVSITLGGDVNNPLQHYHQITLLGVRAATRE